VELINPTLTVGICLVVWLEGIDAFIILLHPQILAPSEWQVEAVHGVLTFL
jgi:hypothetical protein